MPKLTKTDILKKEIVAALEKSLGVVTTACKNVGISRETYYKWLREDEKFKEAVNDIDAVALDFAESQLHKQIMDGSTAATIFYLKTKGKKRGYVERSEFQIENKRPDLSHLTTDELRDLLDNDE